MARYTISAKITIEGNDIKNVDDARQALDIMLGCYEDMDDSDTKISIRIPRFPKKPIKV